MSSFAFSPRRSALIALGLALALPLFGQAIQVKDGASAELAGTVQVSAALPIFPVQSLPLGAVQLKAGLFKDRRELTKAYVLRLKTEDLLQNHLLEAGVRLEKPVEQMHLGWESPSCQLRGHFVGHWLSSAVRFDVLDKDPLLHAREREVVAGLARCQALNQGRWIGSIPEKYFDMLSVGKEPVWSPQYTLHKTLMGLFDAYRYEGDREALAVISGAADWFLDWTGKQLEEGRGEAIYNGECCAMLEVWADLYGATHDARYLTLAERYAHPTLFAEVQAGQDALSNRHANASIPWFQGAARLYEVTGDSRYRDLVFRFWEQAVEKRGMFATTGCNAGEFWIPPQEQGAFLGDRTQEHCTVYNMIRVAEYLYRWTGEARYADYIERALYNGILAQQNANTGLVSYFLPLQPGAQKHWGTETHDFWCCHGTLVQAQTLFENLAYYRQGEALVITQYIPSQYSFGETGKRVQVSQTLGEDYLPREAGALMPSSRLLVEVRIQTDTTTPLELRLRKPVWAEGELELLVDGKPETAAVNAQGFVVLKRDWQGTHLLRLALRKTVRREALPGDPKRFALLDGPVVLAALGDREPVVSAQAEVIPQREHQYVDGRDWQSGHYLVSSAQGRVALKPLHEVVDEHYSVYLSSAP